MANVTINSLANILSAHTPSANDQLAIWDNAASTTKKLSATYYEVNTGDHLKTSHIGSTVAAFAHNHSGVYEPALGNPGTNGYILSSTTGGTRSWIAPPTGGAGGHTIQDEGTSRTARTGLNFIGTSVAATDNSGSDRTDVTIQAYNIVQDNGTPLTARSKINIIGATSIVDDAGNDRTTITVGGSGGVTNLSEGTRTTTTVQVLSSTGTAATLSPVSTGAAGVMGSVDKTKLDGIASSATNNYSNSYLLDRVNHTGLQAISTITSLQATLDGKLDIVGPSAFTFTAQTGVSTSSVRTSNAISILAMPSAGKLSVFNGTYNVNGGAYVSTPTSVNEGDSVTVRHTSSASSSTSVNTVLMVNGVSAIFKSTTA